MYNDTNDNHAKAENEVTTTTLILMTILMGLGCHTSKVATLGLTPESLSSMNDDFGRKCHRAKNYVKKMTPPLSLLKLNVLNRFESHKIKNHDVGCNIGTGKVWI